MQISVNTTDRYKNRDNQQLDKELWRLVSLWVRQSNADYTGKVKCVTCNSFHNWRNVDAGHFVSRRHLITKFNVKNIYPQCLTCNRMNYGNEKAMSRYIDRKHGKGTSENLKLLSKRAFKLDRSDYIELIEHYKQLLIKYKYELR